MYVRIYNHAMPPTDTESGSLEDLDEAGEEMDLDGCYVATEDYLKQDMDEIDLYEGQVVCVIDDSDNGESSLCT